MSVKTQSTSTGAVAELGAPTDEFDPIAEAPPEMKEVAKTWAKRPDPFPVHAINWEHGYKVKLVESDGKWDDDREKRMPKLIYIQFGTGERSDQPKNFEAIKKMLKDEYGMHWNPEVQGWAKNLEFGVSPLTRENNSHDRAAVEEAFFKAVAMEEAVRGPSLSDYARERAAVRR